jgi:hypothetical protein
MRDFNEADRNKKQDRIKISENPAGLTAEELRNLENTVRSSLKDGFMPCPLAWKIAKDAGVPRIAVGEITDRLGIRVTDCQLGCFKVDKTPYDDSIPGEVSAAIDAGLDELKAKDELTCSNAFDLARRVKTTPKAVADAMNRRSIKIRECQLGCF